jgi:hypothetical protein
MSNVESWNLESLFLYPEQVLSFGHSHPSLATEWHPKLNDVSPYDITPDSDYLAIWLCKSSRLVLHIWTMEVCKRVSGEGCPYCAGLSDYRCNGFAAERPDLLLEWFWEKNVGIDPYTLAANGHEKVWWKCKDSKCGCRHEWLSTIANRCYNRSNCPFCVGTKKVCPCGSLAVKYPELLLQWDWKNNGDLDPYTIHPHSSVSVGWKCAIPECGLQWTTKIRSRSRFGRITTCPNCRKRSKREGKEHKKSKKRGDQ